MTEPPSGTPAPVTATLREGRSLDLRSLAEEICRRYRAEFPDEQERYGDAGLAWCVHDNQYLLSWAALDAELEDGHLARQVVWLAGLLDARGYPLASLRRDLEIAAEEVRALADGALSERLSAAAAGISA